MTADRPKQAPFKAFVIPAVLVPLFFIAAWFVLFGPPRGMEPNPRPAGVPSDALWVGGADGGAYVRCSVETAKNADHCEVWNDNTGDLAESGDYQLRGQARAATKQELQGISFPDFDGHIELQEGRWLDRLPKK